MIGDGALAAVIREECHEYDGGEFPMVVAIGDNATRKRVVEENPDVEWSRVVGRQSVMMIGEGTMVLAGAVVATGAVIGRHALINHNAVVDHHSTLENFVHVAPGAVVLGKAKIGEGALIGANAVVLPGTVVPAWQTVRAGSVWKGEGTDAQD